ncbi:hypothetical protein GGQ88_003206 [Novosphingobium hassiacum]|uniref:Uncharacterized protein n=2 Tax=Novosphingobium hassiacum TaxID=173676 RepID=A0A7W6EX56_9SPHN|nr:hypothetical protein [Novosphingobium hassiacum]
MFGPRLSSVFASRWKALWWAASICLLAYCSVPQPDDQAADVRKSALADPWAKDSKPD